MLLLIQLRKTYANNVQVENVPKKFFIKHFSNFYIKEKIFINFCKPLQDRSITIRRSN